MEVRRFDDVASFLEEVEDLLLADPARNNLPLGICSTLGEHPDAHPMFHLWAAFEGSRAVGAALMTEPYNLVLAEPTTPAAVAALVDAVHRSEVHIPGVVANVPWAERVAERWAALTGQPWRVAIAQGVYALANVNDVPSAGGSARVATEGDRDLLRSWLEAFTAEALTATMVRDPDRHDRLLDTRLDHGDAAGIWLWDVGGEPCSLSGYAVTLGGTRIGPVYTPPGLRGRGYATNLVAEQSRWALVRGGGPCFLYTDMSNPTSNAIYIRIGYELVCGSEELTFEPA